MGERWPNRTRIKTSMKPLKDMISVKFVKIYMMA